MLETLTSIHVPFFSVERFLTDTFRLKRYFLSENGVFFEINLSIFRLTRIMRINS